MGMHMKRKVYIETSVISYLTARVSRDLVVAGHQRITQEWWSARRTAFEVFVSQVVLEEASASDQEAARQRLEVLTALPLLEISEAATALAKDLIRIGPLPERAEVDRRTPHRHCGNKPGGLSVDVELYASGECRAASPD